MKKIEKLLEKPWAAYTAAACAAVILFMFLGHLASFKAAVHSVWALISPVFTGIIIAYLFNPVSNFFEKTVFKKMKKDSARHICGVILTIVCMVLVLAILLIALIPSLAQSIAKLIKNWDIYTEKLEGVIDWLSDFCTRHNINVDLSGITKFIDNFMEKIVDFFKGNYKSIFSTVGTVGKGVIDFAIGVLFGFCFLIAKKGLLKIFNKVRTAISPAEKIALRDAFWKRCNKIFLSYVGSTLLDALIVGVATLIFMLIARMPYAPLIAVVVGLTNIIPTFGPLIGNVIGMFFIVLESPVKALIFCAFVCVLQLCDGMLIKPKLFSDSLGIPAVWTMVLIILGGKVAGMAGIILAIPFAAMMVILYQESVAPRLEKRRVKINASAPPEQAEEEKAVLKE